MNSADHYSQSDPYAEPSFVPSPNAERSAVSIVSDLWTHTEQLLSEELALLRADVDRRTEQARNDLIELALAGGVAYAGALAMVAALVFALGKRLDLWLAALIVGALVLAAGYAMFKHSTHKLAQRDVVPRTSIENVETTTRTIKEALR